MSRGGHLVRHGQRHSESYRRGRGTEVDILQRFPKPSLPRPVSQQLPQGISVRESVRATLPLFPLCQQTWR